MFPFLAATLTILVCAPASAPWTRENCQPFRVQPYQSWELCDKARAEGIADGTWLRAAELFSVTPGLIIRLDCAPGRDLVMPASPAP